MFSDVSVEHEISYLVQPTDEPSDVSSDVPSDVVQSFQGQQRSLFRRGGRIRVRGRKLGSGGFCYICGYPNHIRPDCPHSRDCYRCLKPGHVAGYCTASEPVRKVGVESRYDLEGHISNLTTAQHGLILVKPTICRQECSFLVDTGADISLLPYSVVEANHLSAHRHMVRQPVMVDGRN